MAVQRIRAFDDPVLRAVARPVTAFDKELRGLVKSLTLTMRQGAGRAGLAAPAARGAGQGGRLRLRRQGGDTWSTRGWSCRSARSWPTRRACRRLACGGRWSVPSGSPRAVATCTASQ
ncbi:peptide deformylase [Nonomuraea dietziae]|uniref:peptide deformylase n=1 Tax=Nonomuraea dietziae TaxID=65515 RepID=UPI0031DDC08F